MFLLVVGPVVLLALTLLLRAHALRPARPRGDRKTAFSPARSASTSAQLFTAVFALGAFLAGLAGALQLPREPANLGMDLAVIADAFVVTVLGGLGSIPGAFVAAILIGVTKALCIALGNVSIGGVTIALPKLTLVVEFIVMARRAARDARTGLFGTPQAPPATTHRAGSNAR